MSGAEWRFTDEQGVERSVDTDELRSALSSGKMPASTLVWRAGLSAWAPAFTMPELSSAAIAAGRRSIPPTGNAPPGSIRPLATAPPSSVRPIPSGRPAVARPTAGASANPPGKRSAPPPPPRRNIRGVARTLTGIEPPDVLEALGLGKRPADASSTSAEIKEASIAGEATQDTTEPVAKAEGRAANLQPLGEDEESWDDATDVIPRAPGMPRDILSRDILKLATGRTDPPPQPSADQQAPKIETLTGVGGKNLAPARPGQAPSRPPPGLPPRATSSSGAVPTVSFPAIGTSTPASGVPRSRPPPPPVRNKRSEAPPPRLKTLEMQAVPAKAASSGPVSARKPEAPRPKTPPEAAPTRPKPPMAPMRTTSLGIGGQNVAPASPHSETTTIGTATQTLAATETAAPAAASTAPAASASAASTPAAVAASTPAASAVAPAASSAAATAAQVAATPTRSVQRVGSAPTSSAAEAAQKKQDAPAGFNSAAFRAAMQAPTPMAGAAPVTTQLPTTPGDHNEDLETQLQKASPAEQSMRRPVTHEKTEIMIRDAAPAAVDLPPKKANNTLEMELEDHSSAAAKDPAPPESKSLVRTSQAESTRPKRGETTDGTSSNDTGERKSLADDSDSEAQAEDEELAPRKNLHVPMSAVMAVSAAWVLGLVAFFFVGRVSGFKSAGQQTEARAGINSAFVATSASALPPPTAATASAEPLPCWVARQAARWAPEASKTVPFDMRARDGTIDLGFAVDEHHAVGLRIEPKSATFEKVFEQEVKEDISRVAPLAIAGTFYVGASGERTVFPLAGPTTLYLSLDKDSIGVTDAPDQPVVELWKHEGKKPINAEQVLPVADGYLLTFRRDNAIFAGYFGSDKKARGELVQVSTDSEVQNGKPRIGTNGVEAVITYAVETVEKVDDKETKRWKIALARGPVGSVPSSPTFVELPPKQKDKVSDAIAPDIIGLQGGRWLLMWTEGSPGEREIRAQTYDPKLQPLGDPIALSPPGNFGQAVLETVNPYATVAFLQASESGFELWGAVLKCGL